MCRRVAYNCNWQRQLFELLAGISLREFPLTLLLAENGNAAMSAFLREHQFFDCSRARISGLSIGDSHGLGSSPHQDCRWRSQNRVIARR